MKKVLLFLTLFMFASTSYATTYKCYRYVKGEPTGTWVKVQASSKSEATNKALQKYKKLKLRADYVNCH